METWHQMSKRHKEERLKLVEGWAARQVTQAVAAEALGMTRAHLSNFIKHHSIHWPVKMQGTPPKPKKGAREVCLDIPAVRDYYLDGFTLADCSKKFGVHKDTISKHLKRAGVQIRPNIMEQQRIAREQLAATPTHRPSV